MEKSQDKGLQSASEHIFLVPRHGLELETARPSTLWIEEVSKDKGCQPQSKRNPSIPRHGAALETARPSTLRAWCGAGNGTHSATPRHGAALVTARPSTWRVWCGAGNGTHRVTKAEEGARDEEEQEQADRIEAAQDLAAHFGAETSSTVTKKSNCKKCKKRNFILEEQCEIKYQAKGCETSKNSLAKRAQEKTRASRSGGGTGLPEGLTEQAGRHRHLQQQGQERRPP